MIKKMILVILTVLLLSACDVAQSSRNDEPDPRDSLVGGVPKSLIFVEGDLYWFAYEGKYNIEELEYLGDIEVDTNDTPQEEFHSSTGFPVGTKIYRIDEKTLYMEIFVSGENGYGRMASSVGKKQ